MQPTYRTRVEIVRPAPNLCRVSSLRASGKDRQHEQRGGSGRDLADRDHGISPLSIATDTIDGRPAPTDAGRWGDRRS